MATPVQFRPHNRDLGMVMREVDEDLAIFLGMKNDDKRIVLAHIDNFEEFDASTSAETKPDRLLISNGLGEEAFQSFSDNSLLNLETGNDHDWLLAQQDAAANQADASSGKCISLNSELPKSNSLDSSAAANKRPLSSNGKKPSSSRAATPTRRPALPAKPNPSRASTSTSRAPSKPAAATSSKPMAAQARTSTPSRVAPRSSTPTSKTTTPAASSKPASASRISTRSTPASCSDAATRKPATPSTTYTSDGAFSRGKTSSIATKNPVPTRGGRGGGSLPRASNPSEMLSVSHDATQSVKTSMPKRPASASRGRPSAPAAALLSPSKGKPRQKSCSPAKSRAPISNARKNGSMTLSRSRGYGGDDVNPVLMGTKMVEIVVNSRKLAPPKQEHISVENPKRCSHENSGFGRSLSKKSLDMAIRHMDIGRSVNAAGSLRPVATTSVLNYFSNSNESSSSQSSSFGISESPITSSSDSSKSSNCINSYFS